VALAALEPHFMAALARAMGDESSLNRSTIAAFLVTKTRSELDAIAHQWDVPLYTMPSIS
jgi:hypothetical protein